MDLIGLKGRVSVFVPVKPVFNHRIKLLLAASVIACAGVAVPCAPAAAQLGKAADILKMFSGPEKPEKAPLRAMLTAGRVGDMTLDNIEDLRNFYAAGEDEPLWLGDGLPAARARVFYDVIKQSATHGLNPQRYHLQEIGDRIMQLDPTLRAELELFLSDAAVKYAQDMAGQRLAKVPSGEVGSAREKITAFSALGELAKATDPAALFAAMEPQSATYGYLRKALAELSLAPPEPYEKFLPIGFSGIMRPGMWAKDVPKLRGRLGSPVPAQDLTKYDTYLADAVKKFQRESGLKDDGIIGDDTLAALNRTNKDRVAQLKVNMERLRWMEGRAKPEKFVVVNIPAATLWAVDKGAVAFEMPVIVGRPARATPALVTEITGVRFNPQWTVPPTIKKEDILPKLRADPMYLNEKGIELVYYGERGRETIDPAAIDWNTITSRELHSFEMVQGAGDANPLGHVRVLMPNSHSIYLHDTNQREYFDKYARALSSGCIRMKEPLRVAEFIMDGEKGWSMDKVNEVIAQGRTSDRLITNKIPVYILYYTVWMDDQGKVVFGRDIYGRDKVIADMLEKVDGTSLAEHNIIMDTKSGKELASVQPKD